MKLKTLHFQDLLKIFDIHILSTKSIKTGNHYSAQVEEFLLFLEEKEIFDLKKVTQVLAKEYFLFLSQRPKKRGKGTLSDRTINDNLSSLRSFSKRMQEEKVIVNAMPIANNIEIEKMDPTDFTLTREILTVDEVREVFDACKSFVEKALFALAYGCGLRRGTLASLKEHQINFQTGTVTPTMMKNNKTNEIPISDFFLKVLKDYSFERLQILASRNLRVQNFFVDENGKKISGDRLNKILKAICLRTENQVIIDKKITLHCLRHSIATHLIDAGETYDYVRNFLAHSFSDTTSLYAKRQKLKDFYRI
jgi:site-specific recombinase XerD